MTTLHLFCDASMDASGNIVGQAKASADSTLAGIAVIGITDNNVIHVGRRIAHGLNITALELDAIAMAVEYGISVIDNYAQIIVYNDNMSAVSMANRMLTQAWKPKWASASTDCVRVLKQAKKQQIYVKVQHQRRQTCAGIRLADKVSRWVYTGTDEVSMQNSLSYIKNKYQKTHIPTGMEHMLVPDFKQYRESRLIKESAKVNPEFTAIYDANYFEELSMEQMMNRAVKRNKLP